MKKAFWSHFKYFGRLLGNIYLFFTPSKTDGWVPTWLTRKFPSRRMSRHHWPVWVWSRAIMALGVVIGQNSALQGEGGVGRKLVWSQGEINPISGGGGRSGRGSWQIGNPVDSVIRLLNNWGLVFCNQPGYWSLENAIRCFHFISHGHYPLF